MNLMYELKTCKLTIGYILCGLCFCVCIHLPFLNTQFVDFEAFIMHKSVAPQFVIYFN